MKFSKFLSEAISDGQYKTAISVEDALNLIKTKCKNMDIHRPFWRGMSGGKSDSYIFKGESGKRVSSNPKYGNYYTIIMDHFIKKQGSKYPLRSASIIAGNNANYTYTGIYGDRYAIFPLDTTIVGYIKAHDIWQILLEFPGSDTEYNLQEINKMLKDTSSDAIEISDASYEDFMRDIKKLFEMSEWSRSQNQDKFCELFEHNFDLVEKTFADIFKDHGDIYFFGHASDDNNIDDEYEVWIGGECIAIKESVYKKIMKELE